MRNIQLAFPIKISFLIVFNTLIFSCSNITDQSGKQLIESNMKAQEMCWSTGDVDCFMQFYWQSDSLKFIGKNGITYGWQNMVNRYKKSYPDKEAMGLLTFENLHITKLGINHFSVVGKWHLNRKEGDLGGYYSLIWEKINDQWLIVSDHTS